MNKTIENRTKFYVVEVSKKTAQKYESDSMKLGKRYFVKTYYRRVKPKEALSVAMTVSIDLSNGTYTLIPITPETMRVLPSPCEHQVYGDSLTKKVNVFFPDLGLSKKIPEGLITNINGYFYIGCINWLEEAPNEHLWQKYESYSFRHCTIVNELDND